MNVASPDDPVYFEYQVRCINPECHHLHPFSITKSEVTNDVGEIIQTKINRTVQCPRCGEYREYEFTMQH